MKMKEVWGDLMENVGGGLRRRKGDEVVGTKGIRYSRESIDGKVRLRVLDGSLERVVGGEDDDLVFIS